jgi:hypothetical protein
MKKLILIEQLLPYPELLMERWVKGDYSMLKSSKASKYLKDILVHKAKKRPSTRFFGEAYVAITLASSMKEGWYNSFKWLTNDKWLTGKNLDAKFERPFYEALMKYIGENKLSKLQNHARSYLQKKQVNSQAPDLWLIDERDRFRFIEVKKGKDKIHDGQLEGLALIKKYLKSQVSIMSLYPDGKPPPQQKDHSSLFSKIYSSLED